MFEQHIFISYAHLDNKPPTPERNGWISRFHDTLDTFLCQRLGAEAKIWRDDELRGNDLFTQEIVDRFHGAALLIPVVTPRYLNSEWCTREVHEFCIQAERSGDLIVNNKCRVLKVVKIPVDSEQSLPRALQEVLGYDFFVYEQHGPLELDPAYGERFEQEYLRKVCGLANDAAKLIRELESSSVSTTEDSTKRPNVGGLNQHKCIVYLAECSYDLRDTRERLASDLKLHGYGVLPEQRLPRDDEEAYCKGVSACLERSDVSIHLVGASYGAVPEGPSQKSVVELQNELAAHRSRSDALRRLIWLPASTHDLVGQQRCFVDHLLSDSSAQWGADLISGSLEELKTALHAELQALMHRDEERGELPLGQEAEALMVYVVAVEKDREASRPLRRWLHQHHGFDVRMPAFTGDAAVVRQANQELLKECDGLILFYGAGDEAWKRTIGIDLKKIAAYRGGKPLRSRCTYLAPPRTIDKDDMMDVQEPNVIDGLEGFDESAMGPFLATLMDTEPRR